MSSPPLERPSVCLVRKNEIGTVQWSLVGLCQMLYGGRRTEKYLKLSLNKSDLMA